MHRHNFGSLICFSPVLWLSLLIKSDRQSGRERIVNSIAYSPTLV